MEYTDRFCRHFHRLLSRNTLLYTEMVTTGALIHGDRARFLRYDPCEHPLAFQLGGSDPAALAQCAKFVEDAGYDEVNLNCGCPSDRVQTGNFGACLMKTPRLVADCIAAMNDACSIPVTVKNRLGVDDQDSYGQLCDFIGTASESGCRTFVVHARKAWLQGLSPKENREVPPLMYGRVYQLKRDFPALEIIINGGVETLAEAERHLRHVDGVMIGRAAYHNPYLLAEADARIFAANTAAPSREEVLERFADYAAAQVADGIRLNHMTRHIIGLYAGQPGARRFRRYISEHAWRDPSPKAFFRAAAASVSAAPATEQPEAIAP
ncbi:MAG: tRNA dihydrouridine(20/20a) synthase DusA [Porticoccaceae bacterium]|nr:tRNA dihydrouridine(20/20a) synthase DusA [Porticoccaceae bacterium]